MSIDGSKWTNIAKKGHKRDEKDFCQNFHWVILVIDHKCSFNMQKLVKSYERIGKIGHNDNFWVKMGKFWPKKGHKKGEIDFHWVILVIDHGTSFNMQN